MKRLLWCVGCFSLALSHWSMAGPRDLQFRTVDFETAVLELYNFGTGTVSLAGWRFCTHDENQTFRYSDAIGLNGVSMPPQTSFFVHWLNDAPAGTNRINISTIGGSFATPLDFDAYGLGLYINSGFGSGANLADHLQWSSNGVENVSADERSDEAEAGGVWTDQSRWVATTANTRLLVLNDLFGSELHGPEDYTAVDGDVAAWWRFSSQVDTNSVDITGRWATGEAVPGFGRGWEAAECAALLDGGFDLSNPAAYQGPIMSPVPSLNPLPASSNWTIEVIQQLEAGSSSYTLFELQDPVATNGIQSTNTLVAVSWRDDTTAMRITLRDSEFGFNTSRRHDMGSVPADLQYHHMAFVKTNATVSFFFDHVFVQSTNVGTREDGSYNFSNTVVSLGSSLNAAGVAPTNITLDELRITLRELAPSEFLQLGCPRIVRIRDELPSANWGFTARTVTGRSYRVELNSDLPNATNWSQVSTFNATGLLHSAAFINPLSGSPNFRVIRNN